MDSPAAPLPPPEQPARARAVFARNAASLLVVRETAAGPAVLMGLRGRGHRFMPNRLVFPGGAVDRVDATAPVTAEPGPDLLDALGARTRPRLARAIAVCAARELQEETGLSLGDPPALDRLAYLCRAVTPPASPIRFNARFLVVPETATSGTLADGDELSGLAYRPVAEVIREDLVVVTLAVLQRFLELREHGDRAGLHRTVFRHRRWMRDR